MNGQEKHTKRRKKAKKPSKTKDEATHSEPKQQDWFGSMKGTIEILGDIVAPANDEDDWEVLRDWSDDPSKLL
jgi:hypothetical protein